MAALTISEHVTALLIQATRKGVPAAQLFQEWPDSPLKADITAYVLDRGFAHLAEGYRKMAVTAVKQSDPIPSTAVKVLHVARAERAAKHEPILAKAREEGRKRLDKVITQAVVIAAESILTTWLIDGKIPLGMCTREQLIASAERDENTAEGHLKNAVFKRTLAETMKAGQRVQDVFSASEAETVKAEAYKITRAPVLIRHMRNDPQKRLAQ